MHSILMILDIIIIYCYIKIFQMIKILILLLCISPTFLGQKYKKIVHTTDPDAKCLDGSPPALYVHQGSETKKFVIFLEGGGFCQGQSQAAVIQSCYQRSKTILGSSNLWPVEMDGQGYLSTNPAVSQFANWTKLILIYCDGSLHQGYRSAPIAYKNSSLFFRGSKIIKAQLAYIQKNYNITQADKVVWTGVSAGAIGAYLWSSYLRKFVQRQNQLYIVVDSGIFLDFPAHGTQTHHLANELKNLYKLSNSQQSTPLQVCNVFHYGEEWKCYLLQYNYQYLVGNFFYINSQYDSWSIPNILKINCLQKSSTGIGATLSKCNKNQMDGIEKYREAYQLLLFDVMQISNRNSCWSIACSNHGYGCLDPVYSSNLQKIPQLTGTTVKEAVQSYVIGENPRISIMDLLPWPNNHPCAI